MGPNKALFLVVATLLYSSAALKLPSYTQPQNRAVAVSKARDLKNYPLTAIQNSHKSIQALETALEGTALKIRSVAAKNERIKTELSVTYQELKAKALITQSRAGSTSKLVLGTIAAAKAAAEAAAERQLLVEFLLGGYKGALYSGENFTGLKEEYDLNVPQGYDGCNNVQRSTVRSTDTYGTCIRLFSLTSCEGYSIAVYPGSGTAASFVTSKIPGVNSIGPCLQNEFEFSTLSKTSQGVFAGKDRGNHEEIPDIEDIMGSQFYAFSSQVTDYPIEQFLMESASGGSSNKRLKFIHADVSLAHVRGSTTIDNSTLPSALKELWESLDKDEGDQLGYAIPLGFSGPLKVFNAFSQGARNLRDWNGITSRVVPFLNGKSSANEAHFSITFSYANAATTRPYGFYYHIRIMEPNKIFYGFVRN